MTKVEKRGCKTCRWLDVKPDARGRLVVRQDSAFNCLAPIPDLPLLPDAVTMYYNFPAWPPRKKMVSGDEGKDCPTYQKRGASHDR